ncbi:MAG TPA: HNH endonuclease, partial [Micromonosporaceae bacterium]|nr:HNH endonuclease [Micromonosporaceae bacterium]
DNGGDRPQIVVTMNFDDLAAKTGAGMLDTGGMLAPEAVRRLACDAALLPAVLGGQGQVLDVGRERRLFTGPLRRALVLRDGGCAFPGCDRPPRWTDGHHIKHWADGGTTSLDNAVLLCGYHHRLIHRNEWHVRIASDGLPEFLPPHYMGQQTPRRNTFHRRH